MQYFLVTFQTSLGFSSHRYRGLKHPLCNGALDDAIDNVKSGIAEAVFKQSRDVLPKDNISVAPIFFAPIPVEAAREIWPDDFNNKTLCGALRTALLKHDPMGLFKLTHREDEYGYELREVLARLDDVFTMEDLFNKLYGVFILSFSYSEVSNTEVFWDIVADVKQAKPDVFKR